MNVNENIATTSVPDIPFVDIPEGAVFGTVPKSGYFWKILMTSDDDLGFNAWSLQNTLPVRFPDDYRVTYYPNAELIL